MKNRVLMPLIVLLWLCGVAMRYVWFAPRVKAASPERFTHLYSQGQWPPDMTFSVYHDNETGQELICAMNNADSSRCWYSGRVWKSQ